MKARVSQGPIPIKYLGPFIIALLALDSLVKEWLSQLPWWISPTTATAIQNDAFFVLPPLTVTGIILLIPYSRSRFVAITPRSVTRSLLIAVIGVSAFEAVILGVLYYQQLLSGSALNSTALVVKDVILVSGIGVFSLRGFRLLQWYSRIRNYVVLAFALSSFGIVSFAAFHLVRDYVWKPVPTYVLNGIAASFIAFVILTHTGYIPMLRAYFRGFRWVGLGVLLLISPALILPNLLILGFPQLGLHAYPPLSTILVFGFILAGPVLFLGWYSIAPFFKNRVASDYFRTFAYSYGIFAGSTCGMGLALSLSFPLAGYSSLFAFFVSAALSYSAFASLAAYFSITEDVRREIREATGFFTSIGEAEKSISIDRQLSGFHDRFFNLAKASGAVEASALTKDEIYSYAKVMKESGKR